MNNFKKTMLLGLAIALTTVFKFNAQEYAMLMPNTSIDVMDREVSEREITPLLYNKTFSYKYQGDEVLVTFEGDEHTEYFNNKKHYIKSKVSWESERECSMILLESNLPRFPFKSGTVLKMKITKVKRGYIYYESTLGGRTWEGKMKEK